MKKELKILLRYIRYEWLYMYHNKKTKKHLAKENTLEQVTKAQYHLDKMEFYHKKIFN